jgi:hypothetical protein
MENGLIAKLKLLCLTLIFVVVTLQSSNWSVTEGNTITQDSQVSFTLSPVPERPGNYSLVISDTDERNISAMFSVDQLRIMKEVMVEVEKFALTEEAVRATDPITTRFMDKRESAFIVDVQKDANQSRIYLTLSSQIGRLTFEAGRIVRNIRRREGIFFDLLSRLDATLPKPPNK